MILQVAMQGGILRRRRTRKCYSLSDRKKRRKYRKTQGQRSSLQIGIKYCRAEIINHKLNMLRKVEIKSKRNAEAGIVSYSRKGMTTVKA